jgi:hypothetical protein
MRFMRRFAERVQAEGGRVIFGYSGPLLGLFERALPDGVTIETRLETHPDFHCGLMSLPLRLGIVEPVDWGRPYLRAEPERVEAWRERIDLVVPAVNRGQRKVGLVWNGNPVHIRDARRSVPVRQLGQLLAVPGIISRCLRGGPRRSHNGARKKSTSSTRPRTSTQASTTSPR